MLNKPTKIRCKAIRSSAEGENCTLRLVGCCPGNDTVVFAHLNSGWKGTGSKSPDIFGCYACRSCHTKLDNGEAPVYDQLRAMQETQIKLYQKGLIQVK